MPVRIIRQGLARSVVPRASSRAATPPRAYHPGPKIAAQDSDPSVLFSVLIPTVPGRESKLARLLVSLESQVAAHPNVELLVLRDARRMTIGDKRNRMVAIARGEYVAFVDDDDAVAHDYVAAITARLPEKPDVLCFEVTVNGYGPTKPCHYGLKLPNADLGHAYHRKPNHIMVWRRALAVSVPFPAIRVGEDTAWADQICSVATTEIRIDRALYSYDYDPSDNSTTPRTT